MKKNLYTYLAGNEYPGRGICIGRSPDGTKAMIAYWIMGRSVNSRNRVFDPVPERGGICTMAADPDKLEDPSLIIYNPVLTLGKTHIVTNGDQTDTIFDLMSQGKSFADALRTRTFEPDGPNYTPRISAVVYADGSYQMSILKSADGNGDSVQRYFFDYPQPVAGEGHFISTYKHNGNPIPSFEGEPLRFACPRTIGDFAQGLWSSLNPDNKVSLFARVYDLDPGVSGCSLKSVIAAASLLKWADGCNMSIQPVSDIKDAYTQWSDSLSADDQQSFADAWPLIKADAEALLTDKDSMTGRIEDAGLDVKELPGCSEENWKALADVIDVLVPASSEY